jgi:hypothetical protein
MQNSELLKKENKGIFSPFLIPYVDKNEKSENGNYKAPGRSLGKVYLASPWPMGDTLTQKSIWNASWTCQKRLRNAGSPSCSDAYCVSPSRELAHHVLMPFHFLAGEKLDFQTKID